MLRARDAMDRRYAEPLDVPTLARIANVSEAHFIRTFRATFGETPNRYLQRRRVERAMFLLRSGNRSVTDICMDVGFTSLGTFSRVFRDIVGESPSARPGPPAGEAGAAVDERGDRGAGARAGHRGAGRPRSPHRLSLGAIPSATTSAWRR
jgi:AraC-like DNA-binding protein